MGLNVIQERAAASNPGNINRDFEDIDSLFEGKLNELILAVIEAAPESLKILDIGSANHRALSEIVAFVSESVTDVVGVGVDLNPITDETVDATRINSVAADAHDLSCLEAESIDIGYSVATTQYLEDPLKAMFEVNRLLKPGGVFLWKFNTAPTSSHIEPHFKALRDVSPSMQPYFSIQPGIVINHKPSETLPAPVSTLKKLRAAKGSFMSGNYAKYVSECWVTEYGTETVFEYLRKRFSLRSKSHREVQEREKLRDAFSKTFELLALGEGIDQKDVPLAPLLNFTAPSNSQ